MQELLAKTEVWVASSLELLAKTVSGLLRIRSHRRCEETIDILCSALYNQNNNNVWEALSLKKAELISSFLLELRRGTVALCVLAKLGKPTYGYNLIAELSDSGISIEANTIYPLLRRLESQGLLYSQWNTEGAKPRKYYCITEIGKEILDDLTSQWHKTVDHMNTILEFKQSQDEKYNMHNVGT